ncbi:MAG: hypothetical protein H7255_11000 [Ramlibacter sp.]|nr:hypothetical protein [Ramlibacter sp.]
MSASMIGTNFFRTTQILYNAQANAQATLRASLDHSQALRLAGCESEAIACGPDILRAYFQLEHGRELDRARPRTFTEKLYCRMLEVHERGCATYSTLSDKLAVRATVAQRVGERFLTPVLWSGDDAREIPWSRIPADSLLKCNEGSGKGVLLQTPLDIDALQALAARWQAESYYWFRREFHYWDVPRRLFIEERIDDGHPDGPIDYIFYCFDGVPRLLQVGSRSHTLHRFFTPQWEPVQLSYRANPVVAEVPRPAQLDAMLDVAARLSAGFDFVRVDLYRGHGGNVDDIRFGELTFTPRAGSLPFNPSEWDEQLGAWWNYAGAP